MCVGFGVVLVVPSPKSQAQLVGPPLEVSVKVVVTGATPLVRDTVKDAVGTAGVGGGTVVEGSGGRVEPAAGRSAVTHPARGRVEPTFQTGPGTLPPAPPARRVCSAVGPRRPSHA
ncbi:MAG TPA: hypothetical protein VGD39_10655, partial [Nocardioides sp.]